MHPLHARPQRVVTALTPPRYFWTALAVSKGMQSLRTVWPGQGSGQARWPQLGQGFRTPKGARKTSPVRQGQHRVQTCSRL